MSNKILLVDDEIFQLKLIEKLLKSNGYTCKTATSVRQAEAILKNFTPDMIISDYDMPEVNGFVFREKLLENESVKDVPFIFLTSFNNDDLIQRGLDLKALDYIPKNVPPSQLIAKINNIMKAAQEQYQKSLAELRKVAEKLNLKNIPYTAPQLQHFELNFFNQSYQNHPGGDFIDFIKIDDRYTFVVLGDVMGKKWGAWFFSFSFLSYIRSAIRLCVFEGSISLSEILSKINKVIFHDDFFEDVFSTLSILILDDEKGTIDYSGAGDLPVYKYNKDKKELSSFRSRGLLLGFFEDGNYDEQQIQVTEGDEVFVISDGLIDFEVNGKNKSDIKMFENKLLDLKRREVGFEELKNTLINKHETQIDDCSFIVIKRK
ncbi:SpoIIE family protein phosphatase [Pseudopedobacter beijingensis]|uniref:SpoIIE family protein phosphatase n=1 Tax=Pseudopedobacter beijingensis TaxID=1207056 RepID=A0ABW4IIB1_9SPHI